MSHSSSSLSVAAAKTGKAPVPPPAVPPPELRVTGFRLHTGPSIKGFLDILLPCGLHVWNCSYHEQADGKRWIGFPGRWAARENGTKKGQGLYIPALGWHTPEQQKQFQQQALAALELYLRKQCTHLRPDPKVEPPVALPLAGWIKKGGG